MGVDDKELQEFLEKKQQDILYKGVVIFYVENDTNIEETMDILHSRYNEAKKWFALINPSNFSLQKLIKEGVDAVGFDYITLSEIKKAIETVLKYGTYFDNSLIGELVRMYLEKKYKEKEKNTGYRFSLAFEKAKDYFTVRECEIYNLMIKGCTKTQISEKLYLSIHTVRNYMFSIYKILNTNHRINSIRRGVELGIVRVVKVEME